MLDIMRAEHFLELTENLSPSSSALAILSQRYFAPLPTTAERRTVQATLAGTKYMALLNKINELIRLHLESMGATKLDLDLTSEQKTLAIAKAVAYSYLAAAHWKSLLWQMHNAPTSGDKKNDPVEVV